MFEELIIEMKLAQILAINFPWNQILAPFTMNFISSIIIPDNLVSPPAGKENNFNTLEFNESLSHTHIDKNEKLLLYNKNPIKFNEQWNARQK